MFVESARSAHPGQLRERNRSATSVYRGQSSHLPLQAQHGRRDPADLRLVDHPVPGTLAQWFGAGEGTIWLRDIASGLAPGQPVHEILYAAAIIFFCFFYTGLQYNPKETADNLKKSGAFIPGYRPGADGEVHREDHAAAHADRLALPVIVVCFIPNFLIAWKNVRSASAARSS